MLYNFRMSNQQLKNEHSFKDQAELQNTEHTGKFESEFCRTLYTPVMDQISDFNFENLVKKLNMSGIHQEKSQFCPVFSKSCIKTDWESTIYDVKFGNYRTQLKVIYFNLDSNLLFFNDTLGLGGFSQVFRVKTLKGEFALKNIKCKKNKSESVDAALQEIFMAKVLSALEVGPKFVDLFSYDAIVFNDCVQYAMEVCRTKFKKSQIERQLKSKELLLLLKTLHTLNICHMDIKIGNIAWSSSLNCLVFLDFTFTKFINESIGYKTITGFEGTFQYASPQMKKRWILQDKSLVDLYYNDLYCLEGVWKQFQASLKKSDIMLEFYQVFNIDEQNERIRFNTAIVRYFKLKMSLFVKNISQAISLAQKQIYLAWTFNKIFSKYQEKNGREKDICTFSITKEKSLQEKAAQIDKMLLRYELEMDQNPLLVTLLEIIQDGSQSLFEQAWQEDSYKQKMFFFIDVYTNPVLENETLRQILVNKIYLQIHAEQSGTSYTMKFRKVIEYYGKYFCKKNNIEVVEKIMGYFVLMHDRHAKEQLGDMVLKMLEQREEYLEYSDRNFKYFLGDIATLNSMSGWRYERYIENSQNLVQQLSKKMEPTELLIQQILETFRLIEKVKNYRMGTIFNNIDQTEQFRQITVLLNKKGQEIREFTCRAFQYNDGLQLPGFAVKKQPAFKDHFLQKSALQMLIVACIFRERFYSVKTLAESDLFLSKFLTLTHVKILNIYTKPEMQKILKICKDQQKIDNGSGWGLRGQYLWVLDYLYDKIYIANYKLEWLSNLKLSDISNLEKLHNLKIALWIILNYFLNMKFYSKGLKLSKDRQKKLGEITLSFLQYTTNLTRILKEEALKNNSPQLKECIYFKQSVMRDTRLRDMFKKGLALLLLYRVEQAVAVAFEIADEAIKNQNNTILFGFVSYIWEFNQQNCIQRANKLTLKLIPYMITLDFRQSLLQSYVCLKSVMKAFKNNRLRNDALNCIRELCRYVESNNINVTNTNLFLEIKDFLQIWQFSEIKQFLQTLIVWQLSEFICCPTLTYTLYKASQLFPQIILDQDQRRRLVVVMVIFVRSLSHGFFAEYRQNLYEKSFQLRKRKIRTLSELRRLALQSTQAIFTESFASCCKGKHKNLFSREAMEQLVESTRKKAQNYYKNRRGKIKSTD